MTSKKEIDIKSQKKRRDALKDSGKIQISTWINEETKISLSQIQKDNRFTMIGDAIDHLVELNQNE